MPVVTVYVVWPPSEVEGYRKLRDAVSTAAGKKALLSPSAETWTLTFSVDLNTFDLGANAIITGQSDATWRSLANLILRDGARNVSASACVSDSHPTRPLRVVRAWLPSWYRVHPSFSPPAHEPLPCRRTSIRPLYRSASDLVPNHD